MNTQSVPLRWGRLNKSMLQQWSDLITIIAEADQHEEVYSVEDLLEELEFVNFDPEAHSFATWANDTLVAYSAVRVREDPRFDGLGQVSLEIGIHPDWRGQGLETELLEQAETVGHHLVKERTPGVNYDLRLGVRGNHPALLEALESHGYTRVRIYHEMHRLTAEQQAPLPNLSSPQPGITVRPVTWLDIDELRDAHNDAFRQHWGAGLRSEAEWRELMESHVTRLDASRIAVDESGQVLSYAVVDEWVPGNLYIPMLGTRREYQHRGLAHAVLSEVLRAVDDGATERVDLNVDSDSPTDAGRIYTSFGFVTVRTIDIYQKTEKPQPTNIWNSGDDQRNLSLPSSF